MTVAVIGGGIIWGGAEAWSTYKKDRAKLVSYSVAEKSTVVTPGLRHILKRLEDGNEISVVEIKNNGREDLSPLHIKITDTIQRNGSNILEFGQLSKSDNKVVEPKITRNNGSIDIQFGLLRSSEGIKIWIADRGYSSFEILNDQPGTKLEEDYGIPSFWESSFFLYILIGAGAFVLGAMVSESLNRHVLKRIGFDPDEVTRLYTETEKKRG